MVASQPKERSRTLQRVRNRVEPAIEKLVFAFDGVEGVAAMNQETGGLPVDQGVQRFDASDVLVGVGVEGERDAGLGSVERGETVDGAFGTEALVRVVAFHPDDARRDSLVLVRPPRQQSGEMDHMAGGDGQQAVFVWVVRLGGCVLAEQDR
jgi:hypothetical protein